MPLGSAISLNLKYLHKSVDSKRKSNIEWLYYIAEHSHTETEEISAFNILPRYEDIHIIYWTVWCFTAHEHHT